MQLQKLGRQTISIGDEDDDEAEYEDEHCGWLATKYRTASLKKVELEVRVVHMLEKRTSLKRHVHTRFLDYLKHGLVQTQLQIGDSKVKVQESMERDDLIMDQLERDLMDEDINAESNRLVRTIRSLIDDHVDVVVEKLAEKNIISDKDDDLDLHTLTTHQRIEALHEELWPPNGVSLEKNLKDLSEEQLKNVIDLEKDLKSLSEEQMKNVIAELTNYDIYQADLKRLHALPWYKIDFIGQTVDNVLTQECLTNWLRIDMAHTITASK